MFNNQLGGTNTATANLFNNPTNTGTSNLCSNPTGGGTTSIFNNPTSNTGIYYIEYNI